jgi:ADP-ribose pyrophosphatase
MPLCDGDELLLTGKMFQVVRRVSVAADGRKHVREIIRHPGAVVLLPRLDDGRVVLIRNRREAVQQHVIELPAGTLEPGEDPLAAAHRELAEETGYRARSMERLVSFFSSPGILDERMHLYLAKDLTPGPMDLQAGEEIQPLVVPWQEALRMARDGRIIDAKTLIGLLFYESFRGRHKKGDSPLV